MQKSAGSQAEIRNICMKFFLVFMHLYLQLSEKHQQHFQVQPGSDDCILFQSGCRGLRY